MAGEDPHYLRWLGGGLCAAPGCRQMSGPPHHPRHGVGMSQRAHDHRAVPFCQQHHEDAQTYGGAFREMGREGLRTWMDETAKKLRQQYEQAEYSDFPR